MQNKSYESQTFNIIMVDVSGISTLATLCSQTNSRLSSELPLVLALSASKKSTSRGLQTANQPNPQSPKYMIITYFLPQILQHDKFMTWSPGAWGWKMVLCEPRFSLGLGSCHSRRSDLGTRSGSGQQNSGHADVEHAVELRAASWILIIWFLGGFPHNSETI